MRLNIWKFLTYEVITNFILYIYNALNSINTCMVSKRIKIYFSSGSTPGTPLTCSKVRGWILSSYPQFVGAGCKTIIPTFPHLQPSPRKLAIERGRLSSWQTIERGSLSLWQQNIKEPWKNVEAVSESFFSSLCCQEISLGWDFEKNHTWKSAAGVVEWVVLY